MPSSRRNAEQVARQRVIQKTPGRLNARLIETIGLLLVTGIVLFGLVRVTRGKQDAAASARERLERRELVNLNQVTRQEDLLPYLKGFANDAERQFVARKIYDYLSGVDAGGQRRELANVGQLYTIQVSEMEVSSQPGLEEYSARFNVLKEDPSYRARKLAPSPLEMILNWIRQEETAPDRLPLLTLDQLRGNMKPLMVVRSTEEFSARLRWRVAFFLLVFYAVHLLWWLCRFKGDGSILPALLLLTGIGLMLMISLQDPLRDTLLFARFVSGVCWGVAAMGLMACANDLAWFVRHKRATRLERMRGELRSRDHLGSILQDMGYLLPLALSFLLSLGLLSPLGSGPGASSAKVNLFGMQPIEIIKPLLALFFAAYFARHWVMMREMRQLSLARVRLPNWLKLPRLQYLLPILLAVLAAMLFFFFQRDLGPALVIAALFLALYFVARNRAPLSAAGLLAILGGFAAGYFLKAPATVYGRIRMFLSPWDNEVLGGDQVAHSLWGLAAGAAGGTGLGKGRPWLMPEARTDLILSAVGEELGFIGLALVFGIYLWLVYRGVRIALLASSAYQFFLCFGLALLVALQIVLIACGVLGLAPLSGVVSPFLSSGRSAMIANLAIFGLLLSVSGRFGQDEQRDDLSAFRRPVKWLASALALLLCVILGKAAYVQLLRADELLIKPALVVREGGALDFAYNPRILEMRRLIPRGNIYDRNGLPLATSRWEELNQSRARYQRLGVTIPANDGASVSRRHYPFEGLTYHLLGDWRTERDWGRADTSFVERDQNTMLQGFNDFPRVRQVLDRRDGKILNRIERDYRMLIPLWRQRDDPDHPAVKELRESKHDIKLSLDIALQKRLADQLRERLVEVRSQRGAAIVLDAATGEILASVSLPWPSSTLRRASDDAPDGALVGAEDALIDRARYALRPPGSTFKLVTALAALRKDDSLLAKAYECQYVPERQCIGNELKGWGRAICDDDSDVRSHPGGHGSIAMDEGLTLSCNAYFAQLGVYAVKAEGLQETAELFGIRTSRDGTPEALRRSLNQASYGQGEVVVSPFRLALVSATIANGGTMPSTRWLMTRDEQRDSRPVLSRDLAERLAGFMRHVVTGGTGHRLQPSPVAVAGKTGTAQNNDPRSHSWFTGFAPYGQATGRRIAFSVLIENGGYGGNAAAKTALVLVSEAHQLGLIR